MSALGNLGRNARVITGGTMSIGAATVRPWDYDLDLEGWGVKLDRAACRLQELYVELGKFFASNPYGATGKVEGADYVFLIQARRKAPPILGVLVGEYVHQIRSILDQLTSQLADWQRRQLGTRRPGNTSFPVCTDKNEWAERARKAGLHHLPEEWRAFIEAAQPYQSPDPEQDPLAVLNAIWNKDKHRTIPVIPTARHKPPQDLRLTPNADAGTLGEPNPFIDSRLTDGTEIVRVPITPTGNNPHVDMHAMVPVFIHLQRTPNEQPLEFTKVDLLRTLGEAAFIPRGITNRVPPAMPMPVFMTTITT